MSKFLTCLIPQIFPSSKFVLYCSTCYDYVRLITVQLNLNLTFTHVWHTNLWTNFLCHSRVTCEQIIKIYIYTCVTLEFLNKFIGSLRSFTQGVKKFVLLLAHEHWTNLLSFLRVVSERMIWWDHKVYYSWGTYYVYNARMVTAPLNQASTNTPRSVLMVLLNYNFTFTRVVPRQLVWTTFSLSMEYTQLKCSTHATLVDIPHTIYTRGFSTQSTHADMHVCL